MKSFSLSAHKLTGSEQDEEDEGLHDRGSGAGGGDSLVGGTLCEKTVSEILQSLTELNVVKPGLTIMVRYLRTHV